MTPYFPSAENTLIGSLALLIFALSTESVVIVAILKKKSVKASGWFYKFGFEIEASDNEDKEKEASLSNASDEQEKTAVHPR
jgi:hypothetical protein